MKAIFSILLTLTSYALGTTILLANPTAQDTIIIRLGSGEEVMIISEGGNEVELLQQFDMNAILRDLEHTEDTASDGKVYIEIQDQTGEKYDFEEDERSLSLEEKLERLEDRMRRIGRSSSSDAMTSSSNSNSNSSSDRSRRRRSGTSTTMMFDFGLNNYLNNGNFPDDTDELYAVKPLVAWNIALGITNTTHLAGPLYLEWGGNVNWYNFKFQNDRTRMIKTDDGVDFVEDLDVVDPRKSKFVVPYLNAQFVPMFQFGRARRDGWFPLDRDEDSGFRIGMGGYAGYRIGSRHKNVFVEDNDRERVKNRVNYFVNNWRYGVRFQLGFRSFDFYANYDLNELFVEGKGPELNAFSFGIMF
ncbi:hypothetical protein [Tunicatimonas pelagia]|uniref:hypothetical protein n=1 Tax=Tunicatimonas pelagia TaxID=931531 RepID=UPI002666D775|nr:hypothetical protein [Tunicatimonas pelagia]WKN40546.1 hypothetical protein P0M28_16020 [Tunicatimonas pelagia]